MRLAIVVGHSVDYPGAMGTYPIDRYEYYWNLDLSNILYRYARESGLNARVFLRKQNNIEGCYKDVNEWCKGQNAVCIELHYNASNGKAQGTETLWDDEPSDSLEFARAIQEAVCVVFNRKGKLNRGLKKRMPGDRGAANLAAMKVTGCLVEPFFGDNKEDALLAHSKMFDYAKALASTSFKFMIQKEHDSPLLGAT